MSHRGKSSSSHHHHHSSHSRPAGLSPEEEQDYKAALMQTQGYVKGLASSIEPLVKKNPFLQPLCEKSAAVNAIITRLNDCVNPDPVKAYYLSPLLKKALRSVSETFGMTNSAVPTIDSDALKRWKKDEKLSVEERCKRAEVLLMGIRDAIVSSIVGIDPANVLAPHNESHLRDLTKPEDLRIFDERSDINRLEALILAYHKACGEVDNVHLAHSQYLRASLADRIMRFFCDCKLDTRQLAEFSEKYRLEHMNQGVIIAQSKMYLIGNSPADLRKEWCRKTVKALPHLPPEISLHCILAIRESALFFKDKKLAEALSESISQIDAEEAGFAHYLPTVIEAIKTEMPAKKKVTHAAHTDDEEEEHGHGGHGGGKGKKGKKGGHDDHEEEEHGHGGGKGKKGKKGGHGGHDDHGEDDHGHGKSKKGKKGGKHGHHEEEEEHEEEDGSGSGGIIDSITNSFGQMWASIVGSGDEEEGSGGSGGHSSERGRKKSKKGKKGHGHDEEEEEHGHGSSKGKKGSKKGGHGGHDDHEEEEHGHGSSKGKKGSKKGGHGGHDDHEEEEHGHGGGKNKKGSKKGGHGGHGSEEEEDHGHSSAGKRGSKKGGHGGHGSEDEEEHGHGGGKNKKRGSSRHDESDHEPQRESHSASHGNKSRGRKH